MKEAVFNFLCTTFLFFSCSSAVFSQSTEKLKFSSQKSILSPNTLKITANGDPVYFGVLRANDKIVHIEAFSPYWSNLNDKYYYDLLDEKLIVLPKSLFTAKQVTELMSAPYNWKQNGNYLTFYIKKELNKADVLPKYLKYTVEKVALTDGK